MSIMIYLICLLNNNYCLPGQAWVLQEFEFEAEPAQVFPPCCGAGLVQVLVRTLLPPPHVFEH